MKKLLPVACLLAVSGILPGGRAASPSRTWIVDARETQIPAAVAPVWELVWDDSIDGAIDRQAKSCRVRLDFRDGKVTGAFEGLVLGRPREARFSGEIIPSGYTSSLLMEQVEPGYTCDYKMLANGAGYFGVWHDTRGGKGDVELFQANSVTTTSPARHSN